MSSLCEMPELVLENIIGFSDFRSVLTLRQVCKDFLNFIDRLNDSKLPDSEFSKIVLIVDEDISLNYENSNNSQNKFDYSEIANSRSFNGKTTSLHNSDIVDVAIRDLEQVLKFQKAKLDRLCLHIFSPLRNDSKLSNLPVKLSNMFTKLNRKIKTEMLSIKSDNQFEIMSILPFADPETLESLDLFPLRENMKIEMDEIVKTEQWKNANSIQCDFYVLNMKVEDVCGFSTVFIKMFSISSRDLDFLRKAFLTSSKFKDFELHLRNFNENEVILHVWGLAFHSGYWSYWYFRIKDSEEKILRIMIDQEGPQVYFGTTEMRHIPNGAIVQDYNEN